MPVIRIHYFSDDLPRLQKTGDDAFPYYLPQIKRLGILTIKMEDLL